jgi:hypothetical protein
LLPALRALDPKQARQKCFARATGKLTPDVTPEMVCNSEDVIRRNVDIIISQIEAGKKCEPWNDPD